MTDTPKTDWSGIVKPLEWVMRDADFWVASGYQLYHIRRDAKFKREPFEITNGFLHTGRNCSLEEAQALVQAQDTACVLSIIDTDKMDKLIADAERRGMERLAEAQAAELEADINLIQAAQAEIARLKTARGAAGVLLADEDAVYDLCVNYDREDAAQRGESNPHDEDEDPEWTEDRMVCARAALRAIAGDA